MDDPVCSFCRQSINSRAKTIICDGSCGKLFHASCFNVPAEVLKNLNKIDGLSWRCPTCLDEFKTTEDKFKVLLNEITQMFCSVKNDFMKWADSKFVEILNVNKPCEKNLYSSVVATKPAVLIKPKNQQQNNVTKSEILRHINPIESEIKISGVKNIRNGGVLIGCNADSDISKFKQLASEKLGDRYEVKNVGNFSPRIRLVGMSDKFSADEILEFVKFQNKTVPTDTFVGKVLQISSLKKNKEIYQAVLQIDIGSYNKIMSIGNGKLFVGYNLCDVYDCIDIKRCFNCSGFHHFSDKCTSNVHCPRCSEGHAVKECKASVLKCINCLKSNSDNSTNIPINHAAWDSINCSVYKQKISEFKAKFQFDK